MAGNARGGRRFSGPVGCLFLILFLILEIAVGFGFGYVVYRLIFGLFELLGWTGERDFAAVMAVFFAIILTAPVVWWIDRLCKRLVGESALASIPDLPDIS